VPRLAVPSDKETDMTDLDEDAIVDAIERCDDGTAGRRERTIAAAAMVRQAYAYADLEPRAFSRWLNRIAAEFAGGDEDEPVRP
jgi:hypothetical protein